jgi:hypothetical protein
MRKKGHKTFHHGSVVLLLNCSFNSKKKKKQRAPTCDRESGSEKGEKFI